MKRIFLIIISTLFIGCGSSSTSNSVDVNVTLPEAEKPISPIFQDVNLSITTYKFDISNAGGEVEVKYTSLNNNGQANFIITHDINKIGYNTYYPNSFFTGNFILLNEVIYIPKNETNETIINTINVYYIDTEKKLISSFDVLQSTLVAETTIVVNVNNTNEITNDINITNVTNEINVSSDTNTSI